MESFVIKKKIVDGVITSSYDLVFDFTINHLVIDDVYNCIHSGFDFRPKLAIFFKPVPRANFVISEYLTNKRHECLQSFTG